MTTRIRLSALIRSPLTWWLCLGGAGLLIVISQGIVFDLDNLKAHVGALTAYRLDHPRFAAFCYFAVYLTITSLSVPGIIVLSITGGALFGLVWGTVLASFASALGGTLAFLMARRLLRDRLRRLWGQRLAMVEAGMARDGPFYLFGMRLIPVISYFLINLLMGLTRIPLGTFHWVSQLSMLPLILVYVNAGVQVAQLDSVQDLFSSTLLASLGLLAVFPLLARWMIEWVGQYRSRLVGGNLERAAQPPDTLVAENQRPGDQNP